METKTKYTPEQKAEFRAKRNAIRNFLRQAEKQQKELKGQRRPGNSSAAANAQSRIYLNRAAISAVLDYYREIRGLEPVHQSKESYDYYQRALKKCRSAEEGLDTITLY